MSAAVNNAISYTVPIRPECRPKSSDIWPDENPWMDEEQVRETEARIDAERYS